MCVLNALFLSLQFCEFMSVSWLKHLTGNVVRIMLDYVDHVTICSKLKALLMEQKQWAEICRIQGLYIIIMIIIIYSIF